MKYILTLLGAFFSITAQAQFSSQQGVVLNRTYNLMDSFPQSFSLTFKNTSSSVASLPPATGSGASVFKVALNRCINVAPNKSCQITYAPPRNIDLGTYVFILSGMEINYQVIRQDANGPVIIPDVESLEITPSSLAPIQFALGEKKKTVSLSVKNTGNVSVVPSVGWSSNVAVKFSVNRCSSSLAPNKTCTMSLSIPAPPESQEWTQDLQVYVGASLKDSLPLVIRGPTSSNNPNLRFSSSANQIQYRVSSNSNSLVDISSGTLLGQEELYLPPGDYRIFFNASVQNDTNHLIQPSIDLYWPTPSYYNTFNCFALMNDERAWNLPSYYCDLNITSNNEYRITLDNFTIGSPLVVGCTDTQANNQNSNANYNDESMCSYTYGCMDQGANNYNPSATRSDNSCMYDVYGCMDNTAENYDPMANIENGSCSYRQGCTDSAANNFDPSAVQEDGSCEYNTVYNINFLNLSYDPINVEGNVTNEIFSLNGEGGLNSYSSSISSRDDSYYITSAFFGVPTHMECSSVSGEQTEGANFYNPVEFNSALDTYEVSMDSSIYLSNSHQIVNIDCIFQYNL